MAKAKVTYNKGVSGVEISTVGVRAQVALLEKMGVRGADARPAFPTIELLLRQDEQQQFATRGHGRWPALADATRETKARKHQPTATLRASGRLYTSLTAARSRDRWKRQRKQEFRWGTKLFYAFFHQEGHGVPVRKPVDVDAATQRDISKTLGKFISYGSGSASRFLF